MTDMDAFSTELSLGSFVEATRCGESWRDSKEIGVTWDDPRDVLAITLRLKQRPEDISKEFIRVQYWQNNWPKFRGCVGSGRSGWGPIDDFFNGIWKDADFEFDDCGRLWLFGFKRVDEEFPEVDDLDVKYRRTLKVRVVSPKAR